MKVRITGNARRHGRIGDVIDVSNALGCDLICRGVAALVDLAAQPTPQQKKVSVMRKRPEPQAKRRSRLLDADGNTVEQTDDDT